MKWVDQRLARLASLVDVLFTAVRLFQERSRTSARGKDARGSSRGRTSWRVTTASTQARSHSSATCASAPSPAPTTCRCTWSATEHKNTISWSLLKRVTETYSFKNDRVGFLFFFPFLVLSRLYGDGLPTKFQQLTWKCRPTVYLWISHTAQSCSDTNTNLERANTKFFIQFSLYLRFFNLFSVLMVWIKLYSVLL